MDNNTFTFLVVMHNGRGHIKVFNALSKWNCVPKFSQLGSLEKAQFLDEDLDEKNGLRMVIEKVRRQGREAVQQGTMAPTTLHYNSSIF